MARKIFISYDYDNDKHYKNLLVAWDKNKEFDFNFYDQSVDVSVNSDDAAAIRRVISARISDSTLFLCLIGTQTHQSNWIDWEIRKAIELKKKIVAVKINSTNSSPSALIGNTDAWAMSFTFDSIKNAIESV